ncbi:TPR repeat protein (plasmid) [Calothrix sp. NIES-4071]|nr:TPR repeat protein [Calothrix sp. NIES-4071]BAZ64520.1 TPR repeat protein [Calothrix sp. NIES-4105]
MGFFVFKFYQRSRRRAIKLLFLLTLLICLTLAPNWGGVNIGDAVTALTVASQQVRTGVEKYKVGDFQGAIELWNTALSEYKKTNNIKNTAVVSENLARAYQQLGATSQAIGAFETAIAYYQTAPDLQQVGRMQTELAQIYNSVGQPNKAISLVCGVIAVEPEANAKSSFLPQCRDQSAFVLAQKHNDKLGKVAALGTLGEAYRLAGKYSIAIEYLKGAQQIPQPEYEVSVLNSLGNAYASNAARWNLYAESAKQSRVPKEKEFALNAIRDNQIARDYFQASLQRANVLQDKSSQMRSLLNLIHLGYRTQEKNFSTKDIDTAIAQAVALLPQLSNASYKVYATVDLATLSQNRVTSPLTQCLAPSKLSRQESLKLLENAVIISKRIKNARAESFANGSLGHYWECQKDYTQALKYTYQALIAADQNTAAKDSAYLWEWQNGRILNVQGKKLEATAAYQRAFDTLEAIRSDILSAKRDVQLDFRDVVEPLYRELAEQRLDVAQQPTLELKQQKKELSSAIETVDSLKLAELQNFFGNDCIINALSPKKVDELLDANTAVFSSIILDKGTAILLRIFNPSNKEIETRLAWIKDKNQEKDQFVDSQTLRQEVEAFRQSLKEGEEAVNFDTTHAAKLYDWIISPFVDNIPNNIKTLIFIQDGFLRSIPMAALYNRETNQYLVENYAIATTPSLRLTPSKARRDAQRALILGLTEKANVDKKDYDALRYVTSEINEVKRIFPNNTPLINKDFISARFQKALDKTVYPVIHIASHAQFGTIPEDTFIVTGNNNKLTINQLEAALRQVNNKSSAVELITLTACQTAVGDDRSTLGLAGIALQVGVKSALASLWNIQDESTSQLIKEFYTNYRNSNISIAEALRQAQIKMIKAKELPTTQDINIQYKNPKFWAPFVIIGSWL